MHGCQDYLSFALLVYFRIYICIPKLIYVYIIRIYRLLSLWHKFLSNLSKEVNIAGSVLLKALNHLVFVFFPEETFQILDFYFEGVDFLVGDSLLNEEIIYQIDEVLLSSVTLVNFIRITVLVGGNKFLEFGFLFLIGKASGRFGLHRLILNQCIID